MMDPDNIEDLDALWALPSAPEEGFSNEKAKRDAMYEYCYAKRDQLTHHLARGEQMLKAVLADIERLHDEERRELGKARSFLRRATDRRNR